jgi:hypothetical protein
VIVVFAAPSVALEGEMAVNVGAFTVIVSLAVAPA